MTPNNFLIKYGIFNIKIFAPNLPDKGKDRVDLLTLLKMYENEMNDYSTRNQPKSNGKGREIGKLVISDIESRIEKGIETYGEPLKANNGRNPLIDAYQEALDLAIYLRQVLEEQGDNKYRKVLLEDAEKIEITWRFDEQQADPIHKKNFVECLRKRSRKV